MSTHKLLDSNVVFYEGPSLIDGLPILGIMGASTSNPKTGAMAQTWIMRADVNPIEAVRTGADQSVCGNCRHRGLDGEKRTCYVNVAFAPRGIWKNQNRVTLTPAELAPKLEGLAVRLGAYGDPAALPYEVWEQMLVNVRSWTGYTHQWRTCDPRFKAITMASVDTPEERREANLAGWRTFRVRGLDEPLGTREIMCPASDEAGHRTTCSECLLCEGTLKKAKDIAIIVHGARKASFNAAT